MGLLHELFAGRWRGALVRGRRVLVVEDDFLLAEDLREQLECEGAEVMGPVANVADALALLEVGPEPHAAILDIGLGNEVVYPVADALRERGIPFIFATGYDTWAIPRAYADVPRIEKPLALTDGPVPPGSR